MKIINWNLYYENKNLEKSLSLILSKNPDIICLQEFNYKKFSLLKKYKRYRFFHAKSFSILKKSFEEPGYLVVGLKKPIDGKIKVTSTPKLYVNNWVKWFMGWNEGLGSLIMNIKIENKEIRLFNLHLSCAATPSQRLTEMKFFMKYLRPDGNNIVCGDFNVSGKHYHKLFGWLFGFKLKDYFSNERKSFNHLFKKYELKNIFKNKITYPFLNLQLDHILIPKKWGVLKKIVIKKSISYSDHFMLFSDIDYELRKKTLPKVNDFEKVKQGLKEVNKKVNMNVKKLISGSKKLLEK